ncbi:MAG: GIY-YIG nuclease family protein [bacterium]|nr:GIY-YIG nuclease family protein [bacterium]
MEERAYYVYIMMNKWRTVSYIGMTNDLARRVIEHREGIVDGFTKRYRCHDLVYYECCNEVMGALSREKELKKWSRMKKWALIKQQNPDLRDLSLECFV